jgi:hypothetical protein
VDEAGEIAGDEADPWWLDQVDPGTDRWRVKTIQTPISIDDDQTLHDGGREGQQRSEQEPVTETGAI